MQKGNSGNYKLQENKKRWSNRNRASDRETETPGPQDLGKTAGEDETQVN